MIYDISSPISDKLKVWPGDTSPEREIKCEIEKGAEVTLSTLRTTVHVGAHADAPSHYVGDGQTIDRRDLSYYLGPCQVLEVKVPPGSVILPEDIPRPISSERVLFKTGTFPDPEKFNEDFAAFSPPLVDFLNRKGVRLMGIDTPSVDPFDSKELPAHKALARHDMANLEGLVLSGVPMGDYYLIALPLKLEGFDGSPVRAILRTI